VKKKCRRFRKATAGLLLRCLLVNISVRLAVRHADGGAIHHQHTAAFAWKLPQLAGEVAMQTREQPYRQSFACGAVGAHVLMGQRQLQRGTQRLHACDGAAETAIGIQRLAEKGPESHQRRVDAVAAIGSFIPFVGGQPGWQQILKERMQLRETKPVRLTCLAF